MVRVCPDPSRLLDQQADELSRMSELVEDLQPADLHRMLGTLLRHIDELARSVFPRLRLEMALLEICEQGPTLPIAELLDAVQNARSLPMVDSKKKTVAVEPPTRESARTVASQSSSTSSDHSNIVNPPESAHRGIESVPESVAPVQSLRRRKHGCVGS